MTTTVIKEIEIKNGDNISTTAKIGADAANVSYSNSNVSQALYNLGQGKVNTTTTINGKPLTGNITLNANDVTAVPKGIKINGVALDTTDITVDFKRKMKIKTADQTENRFADLTEVGMEIYPLEDKGKFYECYYTHISPQTKGNYTIVFKTATTKYKIASITGMIIANISGTLHYDRVEENFLNNHVEYSTSDGCDCIALNSNEDVSQTFCLKFLLYKI